MLKKLRHCWHVLRELSGDDAYDRYLRHYRDYHANTVDAKPALSRKEFFKLWQETQWKGTKRCC